MGTSGPIPFQPIAQTAYIDAILGAAGLDRQTYRFLRRLVHKVPPSNRTTTFDPDLSISDPFELLVRRWDVRPDEIYEIESLSRPGNHHRVFCGDSSDYDVARYACGHSWPHLMITEPPYPVAERYTRTADVPHSFSDAFHNFFGPTAYVFVPPGSAFFAARDLMRVQFRLNTCLSVDATPPGLPRYRGKGYETTTAVLWHGTRRTGGGAMRRRDETFWAPTPEFPAELLQVSPWITAAIYARILLNHGMRGGTVYDPFAGTGSAILAAEATGNRAVCIDNNPRAVAVMLERCSLLGMKPMRKVKRQTHAPGSTKQVLATRLRVAIPSGLPLARGEAIPGRQAGRSTPRAVRLRQCPDG